MCWQTETLIAAEQGRSGRASAGPWIAAVDAVRGQDSLVTFWTSFRERRKSKKKIRRGISSCWSCDYHSSYIRNSANLLRSSCEQGLPKGRILYGSEYIKKTLNKWESEAAEWTNQCRVQPCPAREPPRMAVVGSVPPCRAMGSPSCRGSAALHRLGCARGCGGPERQWGAAPRHGSLPSFPACSPGCGGLGWVKLLPF